MRSPSKQQERTTSALAALVMSRYWRATEAEQVVEAWRRSGESGAGFARRHGLDVRRLLRWRVRLERAPAPVFHPVRVVERHAATPTLAPLALELRGGRRILVPEDFDVGHLERLVRAIESFGC